MKTMFTERRKKGGIVGWTLSPGSVCLRAPDQAKHLSTIDPSHTVHPSTSISASWGRRFGSRTLRGRNVPLEEGRKKLFFGRAKEDLKE